MAIFGSDGAISTSFLLLFKVLTISVVTSSGETPHGFLVYNTAERGDVHQRSKRYFGFKAQPGFFGFHSRDQSGDLEAAAPVVPDAEQLMKVWLMVLTEMPNSSTSALRQSKKAWTACLEAASGAHFNLSVKHNH